MNRFAVAIEPYRPFFYVPLPAAIGLVVLIALGSVGYSEALALIWFGLFFGLVTLLTIWTALSGTRWPVRVAGLMVGIALQGASLRHISEHDDWRLDALSLFQAAGVIVVLGGVRLYGRQIEWIHAVAPSDESVVMENARQISIWDLMLWAAAAAVLLGVARSMGPMDFSWGELRELATVGLCFALVGLIAFWVAFGSGRLIVRVVVLSVVSLVAAMGMDWFLNEQDALWWVGFMGLQGFFVAGSLWVFRIHGYVLVRRRGNGAQHEK